MRAWLRQSVVRESLAFGLALGAGMGFVLRWFWVGIAVGGAFGLALGFVRERLRRGAR